MRLLGPYQHCTICKTETSHNWVEELTLECGKCRKTTTVTITAMKRREIISRSSDMFENTVVKTTTTYSNEPNVQHIKTKVHPFTKKELQPTIQPPVVKRGWADDL